MDTTLFDSQTAEAKAKQDSLKSELEITSKEYSRACAEFLASEFRRFTERAITDRPDVVEELGIKKLGKLKKELNALIEKCPQIASERLDSATVWEHRRPFPEGLEDRGQASSKAFDYSYKAGGQAYDELREMFGVIGELLLRYGLASAGKGDQWQQRPNALPTYSYGFTVSEQMRAATEKYKELFKEYVETQVRILTLQRQKREALAKNLWDKA